MKTTKRFFTIFLSLLILSGLLTATVYAKVTYVSDNFVYEKINNYTEFEIDEYIGDDSVDFTFASYNSLPITSIGEDAFSGNTTLQTLYLSNSLKYIQKYAFSNATALKKVSCKVSLQLIDESAFSGCISLNSINLEDTVISEVTDSCFMNCDSLTEVTLPETVTAISENAFAYCDSLSKILIPASVTSIADNAFYSSPNVVIYCYTDSAAHSYAQTNSIEYVLLDAVEETEPTVPETQPTEPETQPEASPDQPTIPETQPTEPARTYILGDIDCDGEVAVMDATRIQMILVELIMDSTEEDVIRGDIEKDGVLSIMDVTAIQRYIASYDDGWGIGETFEF